MRKSSEDQARLAPRWEAESRFAQLYDEHRGAVLAYALRRTQRPEDAADLVAETFLIAWRKETEVPGGPEARLWLYAVARRVLSNHRRGERRQVRLVERLRQDLVTMAPCELASRKEPAVMKALSRIEENDRELLLLAGWEELEPAQIADVLGISGAAVRSRLHRARQRLKVELDAESREAQPSAKLGLGGVE